jgi:hypothetical protein
MYFKETPWKVEIIDNFGKKWVWYNSTTIDLHFSNDVDVYVTKRKGDKPVKIRSKNQVQTL